MYVAYNNWSNNTSVANESFDNESDLTTYCKYIAVGIWISLGFTGLGACSDIIFIIACIPFTSMTYLINGWIFGRFLCKFSQYLTFVTLCANCLGLTVMTIDRYIYVISIHKKRWRKSSYVLKSISIIWTISLLLSMPTFLNYDVLTQEYAETMNTTYSKISLIEECIQKPESSWSINVNHWYTTIVSYIIPSFVLIICYVRIISFMNKKGINLNNTTKSNRKLTKKKTKKVTKSVMTLILTFVILWFPVHFLASWYRIDENFPEDDISFIFKLVAHTMSYSVSTINPFIYSGCFDRINKNGACVPSTSKNAQKTSKNPHSVNRSNFIRETTNKEIQMIKLN